MNGEKKGGLHRPIPYLTPFVSPSISSFVFHFPEYLNEQGAMFGGQPTAQFMKLNWNIAREMFMVSIPLWLFWAMIKDHLGHVKYVQDTEREIEGKKR